MSDKDWSKELEAYLGRAAKRQHISDKKIIAEQNPIRKKIHQEKAIQSWQDPNHREKMKQVHADRSKTEWKKKVATANKWENKSEEAKQNILAGREALKSNKKFKDSIKKRDADPEWQKANKLASEKKWKDPNNIKVCPHCEKQSSANTYDRHLKSCLFVNGYVMTMISDDAQFIYQNEQALIDDGFDLMRVKQVINTNKAHAGYTFKHTPKQSPQ